MDRFRHCFYKTSDLGEKRTAQYMISEYCKQIFDKTPFMQTLQASLLEAFEGNCVIEAAINSSLVQHNGYVHAGVQASLADHACGVATASMIAQSATPLSIEFKINMLRPAIGDKLQARAKVLRCGKTIAVVECDVFALKGEEAVQTAKMLASIAIVNKRAN